MTIEERATKSTLPVGKVTIEEIVAAELEKAAVQQGEINNRWMKTIDDNNERHAAELAQERANWQALETKYKQAVMQYRDERDDAYEQAAKLAEDCDEQTGFGRIIARKIRQFFAKPQEPKANLEGWEYLRQQQEMHKAELAKAKQQADYIERGLIKQIQELVKINAKAAFRAMG